MKEFVILNFVNTIGKLKTKKLENGQLVDFENDAKILMDFFHYYIPWGTRMEFKKLLNRS